MTPIVAVGFELWTVTEDVYFDNIIITSELTAANNFAYERSVLQAVSIYSGCHTIHFTHVRVAGRNRTLAHSPLLEK